MIIFVLASLFFEVNFFLIPLAPQIIDFTQKKILPVLSVSGILYPEYAILAVMLIYLFYFVFFLLLDLTAYLGNYNKKEAKKNRFNYTLKIIGCYLVLTFPVYLTIFTLVQLPANPTIVDYGLMFPVMTSFLISLRFLANPTEFIHNWRYKEIPLEDIKKHAAYIKEQVISFYFALIEAGIFIILIGIVFKDTKERLTSNLIGMFSSPENLAVFIISYLLSLVLLGLLGELYLDYAKVIDINPES
ncbi:MAG: hypothetical protein ABSB80_07185 [Methanoregula sp.]|jgi:hypothetical protein|uniref:hypothetical protein n=1 Tax=Methanoregula sp. TaxID=2052170 RepID=UPI003D1233F1